MIPTSHDRIAAIARSDSPYGGLHGRRSRPRVTLPACQAFLAKHPQAELILVGRAEALAPARAWPRCHVVEAAEVVEMDDPLEVALRKKRDSSMRVAIQQLRPASPRRWSPTPACRPATPAR